MMTIDQNNRVRQTLIDLPDPISYGEDPPIECVHLPLTHLKALDPNALVVTGMRGAGKTFWWSALQSQEIRHLIHQHLIPSLIRSSTEVYTGYGVTIAPDKYPNRDVLEQLVQKEQVTPRIVWRTVQAWQVAPTGHPLRRQRNWHDRVRYSVANPEHIDLIFLEKDGQLKKNGVWGMILFDALDRCTDNWQTMYQIIRGLLQTVLEMRSYSHLRIKVFLRTDQLEAKRVLDFPDSSKLLASCVELKWPREELYNLMWKYILSGDDGKEIASILQTSPDTGRIIVQRQLFPEYERYAWSESRKRIEFHKISGPWMGQDRRRGFPYTWIPSHLRDGAGNVTPRSFLAAIRTAAIDSMRSHPDHQYALHYQSIKRGVQEASKIRVNELREDYPWVHNVMSSLEGSVVPCSFEDIERRWTNDGILDDLVREISGGEVKLPPRHAREGADGVRKDLESLGVFERMRDGRVNIPDVFRVGYGLGRRGGVKPVR